MKAGTRRWHVQVLATNDAFHPSGYVETAILVVLNTNHLRNF